jgi:hypothetical protein
MIEKKDQDPTPSEFPRAPVVSPNSIPLEPLNGSPEAPFTPLNTTSYITPNMPPSKILFVPPNTNPDPNGFNLQKILHAASNIAVRFKAKPAVS